MSLEIALMIVGFLIVIVGIVSGITSIWLVIKYYRFNRRENSLGLTGIEVARKILDDNGLEHIKVKRTGSLLFGNSYSHYFNCSHYACCRHSYQEGRRWTRFLQAGKNNRKL